MNERTNRRRFLQASAATALLGAVPLRAVAALEKSELKIGIPSEALTFLPLYLGLQQTWKDQGLDVQLFSFRGDADVTQGLAGGSLDIACASLIGLGEMIEAEQPVSGFYQGFYQSAGMSWAAQPSIKSWADLKGKSIGVSTFGSLFDVLTRYVLQKHHLVPEKDVNVVQAGGAPFSYPAMKAGKLDAAMLIDPFTWQARDAGFNILGTLDKEVAPLWPIHIWFAKTAFINENPNTVAAVLRGHVAAIRLARANKALSERVLEDRLKFPPDEAQRAYDDVIGGYNERGTLPEKVMPVFWDIVVQSGAVKKPIPDARLLDTRYIRTFNQWAPKA
jgi:NitT/TauT family transport system substrate-binding protein